MTSLQMAHAHHQRGSPCHLVSRNIIKVGKRPAGASSRPVSGVKGIESSLGCRYEFRVYFTMI